MKLLLNSTLKKKKEIIYRSWVFYLRDMALGQIPSPKLLASHFEIKEIPLSI
jgi:hypothetical protein